MAFLTLVVILQGMYLVYLGGIIGEMGEDEE